MKRNVFHILLIFSAAIFLLSSCNKQGTGYEFMPNMYRSPSLETYGKNNFFADSLNAIIPVLGTIPRGFIPFEFGFRFEFRFEFGLEYEF